MASRFAMTKKGAKNSAGGMILRLPLAASRSETSPRWWGIRLPSQNTGDGSVELYWEGLGQIGWLLIRIAEV